MDDVQVLEQNQFEELIQGLIKDDYGCCNDFFADKTMSGLRSNMRNLNISGGMKPAGIGNNTDYELK